MKFKNYELIPNLRDNLKPDWKEMLNPSKPRNIVPDIYANMPFLSKSEKLLLNLDISLVGKDILEVGCGYGSHAYLMAKYEGTRVHAIDVDDYYVNQSIDLNIWNPEDIELMHNKLDVVRQELGKKFPKCIADKVTFETVGMESYATPNLHDIIISWDVLEHILDLPLAFNQMANAVKKDGIVIHEYNPFFSLTGGHSLCTLDFHFGHCRLSKEDFKQYIKELRPNEEKATLNFYNKCLNRATISDIKKYATQSGFEILKVGGHIPFPAPELEIREELEKDILPDVIKLYPNVTVEDLLWDSVHIILRR
jgi:cyclopropane fatty-acyl-phospholipid synthase-like methyltransferase